VLDELEFPSSPPSIRKGFPSTISWVALPFFCKCGIFCTGWAYEKPAKNKKTTIISKDEKHLIQFFIGLIFIFR
jgi:hypothetical protein